MTEQPPKQDIEELVRRLETQNYPVVHIREAGQILVSLHHKNQAYPMALEFAASPHRQVRMLGMTMMEALAPDSEAAKGYLAGIRDAEKLLGKPNELAVTDKPPVPDYSAIGEVIKVWMREA